MVHKFVVHKLVYQQIMEKYRLGTKSNISRLKSSLEDKELVETAKRITTMTDPVFELWFDKFCVALH